MTKSLRAVLLCALLSIAVAPACKIADQATPEENARIEQMTAAEEAAYQRAANAERALLAAQAENDTLRAAEAAGRRDAALGEAERVAAERATLEKSIAERSVGWFVDLVDGFIPIPLQPWKGTMASLVALAAFPRTRSNMKRGAKALGQFQLKEAGMSLLRLTPFVHSNNDPLAVMRGAVKAAGARGDVVLERIMAKKLQEAEAELAAEAVKAA